MYMRAMVNKANRFTAAANEDSAKRRRRWSEQVMEDVGAPEIAVNMTPWNTKYKFASSKAFDWRLWIRSPAFQLYCSCPRPFLLLLFHPWWIEGRR